MFFVLFVFLIHNKTSFTYPVVFCAWSLCALLRIQQKRLAAPPPLERFIITRGSAATPRWEWERGAKRDIAEVKFHTLTWSIHSVIQLATGGSRLRVIYFNNETNAAAMAKTDPPPPAACCLHQAAGFGCSSHEKPVALCPVFHKLPLTFPSPVLHFNMTLPRFFPHFHYKDCWCTFTIGSLG